MKNLLTLFFLTFSLLLTAQDFTISNFNVDIEINADGSYDVVETIDVYFTKKKRGIFREIHNTYSINGGKVFLDINSIDIPNYEYTVDKSKEIIKIKIGSQDKFLTGNQQYKIAYNIKKGIISYDDHQEFHYDLTGVDWPAAIRRVNFTIRLPRGITLNPSDLKVTGGRKNENLDIAEIRQIDPRTIKGSSLRPLNAYNGITAAIKLPKSYLDVASNKVTYYNSPQDSESGSSDSKPWYIALPIAIFGFFWSFWNKKRKTNYVEDNEGVHIYPPKGLTSAHVGAYVDQKAHTRDIVSLLPYWGAEGYLEMKQMEEETYLYKIKNLPADFPEYEHIIFDRLFSENEVAKISDLQTKFHTTLAKAQSLLTEEVGLQDYYDPEYIKLFRGPRVAIFPLAMLALGLVCIFGFQLIFLALGFFGAAIGGFILPFMKLPLTDKGAKLKHEIDSFNDFLKNPDKQLLDNAIKDDPAYFDKMFPFVVAFGLEKSFLSRVDPYMSTAPYWYLSHHQNNTFANFSSSFKPEVIQSAFSSIPQSSSSGGGSSSGGFSSGSGVGGGGGGSW